MKIKLVIDGADQRVRIEPQSAADRKLLEYVVAWDIGRIKAQRKSTYSYDSDKAITQVDLILEVEPLDNPN